MTEIARHRTALARTDLSRPIRLALDDGLIQERTTLTDYGCGLGGDVRRLRERGFDCVGWDPNHWPDGQRRASEVVNLGYVINVIEHAGERVEALRAAWGLAQNALVVSARLKTELGVSEEPGRAFADGRLTRLQTFQKFFEQQELRSWIDQTLGVASVAAAPGVFYVFRNEADRETFVARRVRRIMAAPRLAARDVLFSRHRSLFEGLAAFMADRGRLPVVEEFADYEALVAATGSLPRALRILEHASDAGAWQAVRDARTQDLLIYLALTRFDRRPRFADLPEVMQRDVRAFCGSYASACKAADALLFSLGKPGEIEAACRSSIVGKSMPTALYVHASSLTELVPALRLFEGCARTYLGAVPGANVIKLGRDEPKVTYLTYPGFETEPHPPLHASVSVHLQTFRVKQRSFDPTGNPPILHRKELFLAPSHPLRAKFERLTRQEERFGLFEDPARIGLRKGWEAVLADRNLNLRGHRIVRIQPEAPDPPAN